MAQRMDAAVQIAQNWLYTWVGKLEGVTATFGSHLLRSMIVARNTNTAWNRELKVSANLILESRLLNSWSPWVEEG